MSTEPSPRRTPAALAALSIALVALASSALGWAWLHQSGNRSQTTTAASQDTPTSVFEDVGALERHLKDEPRDGRAWVLLARARMQANEFDAAARAFTQAMQVSTRVARDPGVLCEAADALGMAQGGELAGRPSELIAAALAIDGRHPVALEMAGSAAIAQGRHAEAIQHWSLALERLPPDSLRQRELAAAIEAARRRLELRS